MAAASKHLVLIPSYNSGAQLAATVRATLDVWPDVWVVVDGSTDGSAEPLVTLSVTAPGFRLLLRAENGGKGAAVATGIEAAAAAGFTHALVMDADGQHPVNKVRTFLTLSQDAPDALILGQPEFGPDAPLERLYGRRLSVGLTRLETLGRAIADPLFGFRVYPIAPLRRAFAETRGGRRYDFDPEMAVRLYWAGVPIINAPAPCRYLSRAEGGVSHYHYVRDNLRMVRLHVRLVTELVTRRWGTVRHLRRAAKGSPPS